MKNYFDLTASDITQHISKEFKNGLKNGYDNGYDRSSVIDNIKNSYDSPLVSAYWQGILWALDHPTE
jgi:hypothetical protein